MNVTCLNYHFTNCYLIPAGSQLLMIDADWAGTLHKLFHAMGEAGVRMQDVGYLLVTHYDPDHAGIAQDIKELGVQLVVIDLQVPHMSRPEPIFRKEGRGLYKPLTPDNTSVIACDESRHGWSRSVLRARSSIPLVTPMTASR